MNQDTPAPAPRAHQKRPVGKKPKEKMTPLKLVEKLMRERKVRGNPKDWVIIHAGLMMDWEGTYQLTVTQTGEKVSVQEVALLHKRDLASFMKPEHARQFWNPALGMRVSKLARAGLRAKEAPGGRAQAAPAEPAAV